MAFQNTKAADYGLRGVLYLALQPRGRAVRLREVASAIAVSPHYLSKIFQLLTQAGVLHVRRGTGGGYSLAIPPEELTPRVVLEALGGRVELSECLSLRSPCPRRVSCPYFPMWIAAQEALLKELERYSYARLAGDCSKTQSPPDRKGVPAPVRPGAGPRATAHPGHPRALQPARSTPELRAEREIVRQGAPASGMRLCRARRIPKR